MAEMGSGYGSECHLLRYLGRHRRMLDDHVLAATGAIKATWLDHPFDRSKTWLDGEWKGLDFLDTESSARQAWIRDWPQTGNVPNWDAIATLTYPAQTEWLLVEAKANLQELRSSCNAKEEGGRGLIARTLAGVRDRLGALAESDWLNRYYQYANRLAVLETMNRNGTPARLLNVYFLGDQSGPGRSCPGTEGEWHSALRDRADHLGLSGGHPLADRIHNLFLNVCPSETGLAAGPK